MDPNNEEKKFHVFYSRIPFLNFVFRSGKKAEFIVGRFITDVENEAKELIDEIEGKHPHIYQKVGEEKASESDLDPMKELKDKIIAEYEANKARALLADNDRGNTESDPNAAQRTASTTSDTTTGVSVAAKVDLSKVKASIAKAPIVPGNTGDK